MEKYTLSQMLTDELNKNYFSSLKEEITPSGRDETRNIGANLVGVNFDRFPRDEKPYEFAVREYARTRDLIDAERAKSGHTLMASLLWSQDEDTRNKMETWLYPSAFFILPENLIASFLEYNTPEFSDFCKSNGVNYIVKDGDHYNNLTKGRKFRIKCEEVPGMADDAATYLEYSVCFLDDRRDK